jgi:hypothetical protein
MLPKEFLPRGEDILISQKITLVALTPSTHFGRAKLTTRPPTKNSSSRAKTTNTINFLSCTFTHPMYH